VPSPLLEELLYRHQSEVDRRKSCTTQSPPNAASLTLDARGCGMAARPVVAPYQMAMSGTPEVPSIIAKGWAFW